MPSFGVLLLLTSPKNLVGFFLLSSLFFTVTDSVCIRIDRATFFFFFFFPKFDTRRMRWFAGPIPCLSSLSVCPLFCLSTCLSVSLSHCGPASIIRTHTYLIGEEDGFCQTRFSRLDFLNLLQQCLLVGARLIRNYYMSSGGNLVGRSICRTRFKDSKSLCLVYNFATFWHMSF